MVVAGPDVRVPAQPVVVLSHHQNDLAVGLQPEHPVGHMDSVGRQLTCPLDVGGFVEACLQLDHHGHLFALASRVLQMVDDAASRRHPVEGHLDGTHLRVPGRLAEEAKHRCVECLVRVVQQDRAFFPDDLEDRAVVEQVGVLGGVVSGILQPRPGQVVKRHQVPQAQQPAAFEDVAVLQAELLGEHRSPGRIETLLDLQAHDRSQTALPQTRLDELEQVVGHVLVHVVDGVPGHPADLAGPDLHPREQKIEVVGHHALKGDPLAGLRHPDQPRDARPNRYLHARQRAVLLTRVAQRHQQIERQIRDEGEGVGRVGRLGGHKRVDVAHIVDAQPLPVTPAQVLPVQDLDPLLGQQPQNLPSGLPLPRLEPAHDFVALLDLFTGGATVDRPLGDPRLGLLLQTADPLHEELVEIRSDDRQELHALQQRGPRVFSLVQHAEVEVEPGQLAVQVVLGTPQVVFTRRRGNGSRVGRGAEGSLIRPFGAVPHGRFGRCGIGLRHNRIRS